jgi:hypothetical protein
MKSFAYDFSTTKLDEHEGNPFAPFQSFQGGKGGKAGRIYWSPQQASDMLLTMSFVLFHSSRALKRSLRTNGWDPRMHARPKGTLADAQVIFSNPLSAKFLAAAGSLKSIPTSNGLPEVRLQFQLSKLC